MFGRIKNFFLPVKVASKRINSLILSAFVLQAVAVGFCVPMASATSIKQVSMMEYCMDSSMNMDEMTMLDTGMGQHACAHCDLPDVSIALDKHGFTVSDLVADVVVIALVPTALDVVVHSFTDAPPGVSSLRHTLTAYNLNLRIRV